MRFNAGGGSSRVYYLEDGMGSVIGLAPASSPSPANTSTLFYDGFGTTRLTNGPPPSMPAGTGGDFRFHGAWLEEFSGLYNIHAREYDSRTGRFTSRDPRNGVFQRAETLNPYAYAVNNPVVFTDPSGELTLTEITVTDAINVSLEALKNVVLSEVKGRIRSVLCDAFGKIMVYSLDAFFPSAGDLFGGILQGKNPGTVLEEELKGKLCGMLPGSAIINYLSFYPGIKVDGTAVSDGIKCPGKMDFFPQLDTYYPDFILGEGSPKELSSPQTESKDKSVLVGDVKLSGNSLYKQYVLNQKKRGQLYAITGYARKHTYTHVALFLTFFSGERKNMQQVGALIRDAGASNGVLIFVVSAKKNKNY